MYSEREIGASSGAAREKETQFPCGAQTYQTWDDLSLSQESVASLNEWCKHLRRKVYTKLLNYPQIPVTLSNFKSYYTKIIPKKCYRKEFRINTYMFITI